LSTSPAAAAGRFAHCGISWFSFSPYHLLIPRVLRLGVWGMVIGPPERRVPKGSEALDLVDAIILPIEARVLISLSNKLAWVLSHSWMRRTLRQFISTEVPILHNFPGGVHYFILDLLVVLRIFANTNFWIFGSVRFTNSSPPPHLLPPYLSTPINPFSPIFSAIIYSFQ
jgi:hypothetical protein